MMRTVRSGTAKQNKRAKTYAVALLAAFFAFTILTPFQNRAAAAGGTQISASSGSTPFTASGAVVVDSQLLVSGSDAIDGTKVMIENLKSGDTLGFSSGSLPSGVTGSYNSSTGVLTFTGSASADNWQTLLRTVTYNTSSSIPETRRITFSLGNAITLNGHYYEYIEGSMSWTTARSNAAARTFFGLRGYLATITSAEENQFIYNKLKADAWVGASDDPAYSGSSGYEGAWYWVTGPDAGTLFSVGNNYPVVQSGRYMNWNSGEPNNAGNENFCEIYSSGASSGRWNDLADSSALGYVVEYGGSSGDPSVQVSAEKDVVNRQSFDITYSLDGGTNYDGAPSSYSYGDTIVLGTPTKTGCDFSGWYDAAAGGSRVTQISSSTYGSVTLYARWAVQTFTVTFKDYNNQVLKTQVVNYNASATPPNNPVRTGYSFDHWDGTYANVQQNQSVTAVYTPNTNTAYKVRHYQQNVTGSGYTLFETENLNGTSDTTAAAAAKTYTGFLENTAASGRLASGSIAPDGSLVLALYYDRQTYSVTFENYDAAVLESEIVRYKGSATPPLAQRTGYTLDHWSGTYTNVTKDETVTAVFSPNTNTPYKVEHYRQDVTGDGYTLFETENLTGTTDTMATATAKSYTGFYENVSAPTRVNTGNIAPDGSLVLSLYYDRNSCTVKFADYDGGTLKTQTVRYQGTAMPPEDPSRLGYTFDRWSGVYSNVPTDETVTAVYAPNTNTAYKVNHYQQDVTGSGYTLYETQDLTGTTDTTASASARTYTGFFENTSASNRAASGNIAPDGSLVLSLYYDRQTFDVTFRNYDDMILKRQTVRYEGDATPPALTGRTGYTFDHWSGTYANVTSDLSVTAVYTPNTDTAYTVQHYRQDVTGDGYTLFETQNLTGTTDTTASAEEKTFTGFHGNTEHAYRRASGNIEPDGSLVLKLYYDRNEYAVAFKDYNGTALKTETVRFEGTATPPSDPTKLGYTFDHWDGTYANIDKAQIVKAVYTPNTDTAYTVQHYRQDVTGEGYALLETQNLIGTTDTTATASAKSYAGFFENTTSGQRVPSGNIEADASLVLKLYYNRIPCTVTFKDFDGTALKTEIVRYEGTAVPPEEPLRVGYTFSKWEGTYEGVIKDESVSAAYTVNAYAMHFDSTGGSEVADESVNYLCAAVKPADPTKDGYRFAGWYTNSLYETIWDFAKDTMPASEATLFAKWVATPSAPALQTRTATSITLVDRSNMEYRIDGGSWQSSAEFYNLTPDTDYSFQARTVARGLDPASYATKAEVIRTNSISLTADTDGNSVTATGDSSFDPDTQLVIDNVNSEVQAQGSAASQANIALSAEGMAIRELYDVKLLLGGQKIQPNGTIEIRIKLSDDLLANAAELKIFYIDDLGNYQLLEHRIEGNTIVFSVDHLSHYAVVAPKATKSQSGTNGQSTATGKAGLGIGGGGTIVFFKIGAVFLLAFFLLLLLLRRRKKQED